MTTQTAASLDAQIAKPRATPLEIEDGHVLTDCRVQMFGPVIVTPPPVTGPADYVVSPSTWTFGSGNYRLTGIACKSTVLIQFTTGPHGTGANINLQVATGQGTMHTMTIDGVWKQSQSPAFTLGAEKAGPSTRQILKANTVYQIKIDTPNPAAGTYHINFNNSPY